MPEHIRALFFILLMAGIGFTLSRKFIPGFIEGSSFTKRRNAWFFLTITAFLTANFWIYALMMFLYLSYSMRKENNYIALYFALLFVLPDSDAIVPGFGLINYLIGLSHQKLLVLFILLPAMLRSKSKKASSGNILPDKILLIYFAYLMFTYFRDTEFTNAIRYGVTTLITMVLPYYAISRHLRNPSEFREAILSLLIAMFVLASISALEFVKHWLLYPTIANAMDLSRGGSYLGREGMLRAMASTGSSIALGLTMTVGIGLFMYYQNVTARKSTIKHGWFALGVGQIAALSRGPWVGAILTIIAFIMTGKNHVRSMSKLLIIGIIALGVLSLTPMGQKIIDFLPFVGKVDNRNISFREQLITNSLITIQRNPLTGAADFQKYPEMQEMFNGVVIDITNTYLLLALSTGLIGVGLFVLFFALLARQILKSLKAIPDKSSEVHVLGRALFAAICGMMLIIGTVSPIGIIPTIYWAIAGLSAAYIRMVKADFAKPKLT